MASTTQGKKVIRDFPPPLFNTNVTMEIFSPLLFNTNATMEMKTKHQFFPHPSMTGYLTREMFLGDGNKNHTGNCLVGKSTGVSGGLCWTDII